MFYVSLSAGEIHINLAVTTRIQFKWLNIFGFLVPASNGILILNGKSNFNNLTSSTSGGTILQGSFESQKQPGATVIDFDPIQLLYYPVFESRCTADKDLKSRNFIGRDLEVGRHTFKGNDVVVFCSNGHISIGGTPRTVVLTTLQIYVR